MPENSNDLVKEADNYYAKRWSGYDDPVFKRFICESFICGAFVAYGEVMTEMLEKKDPATVVLHLYEDAEKLVAAIVKASTQTL